MGRSHRESSFDLDTVGVVVDGNFHPETVPTETALALAHAFFHLLSKASGEAPLSFTGLSIEDGCFQLAARSDSPAVAVAALSVVAEHLRDIDHAPKPLRRSLRDLVHAREAFGAAPTVAFVGRTTFEIPRSDESEETYVDTTTLYATVVAVGGKSPRITLASRSEPKQFSAVVDDVADARELAPMLYTDIEVEIEATRLVSNGRIRDARLLAWHRLSDADPVVALRRYISGLEDAADED